MAIRSAREKNNKKIDQINVYNLFWGSHAESSPVATPPRLCRTVETKLDVITPLILEIGEVGDFNISPSQIGGN